jgi:DNA-binding transcriptional MerR regulator
MRYSVKAAARATGISESALRTWERRYGIPAPSRSPSGRRMYEEKDLETVRRMASLIGAGMPASEAASAVLSSAEAGLPAVAEAAHPLIARIVAAALAHDEAAVVRMLRAARIELDWAGVVDGVYFGSLREIGGMWRQNQVPSATEHFLTEIVRRELCSAIADLESVPDGPLVVLACPQDERHDVGLLAFSLLLRLRDVGVCYLGSDVPTDDLIDVLAQHNAAAVCMSATLGSSRASASRAARQILGRKLGTAVFVGGPAFTHAEDEDYVPGILLPWALSAAAQVVASRVKKEEK